MTDLQAWEKLIAERLEADAATRGNAYTSRQALKCLRNLFALERDTALRAKMYGLLGLGEDLVDELCGSGAKMVLEAHAILSEFDRAGLEEEDRVSDAMQAVWHGSLGEWGEFTRAYCRLAQKAMLVGADLNAMMAPVAMREVVMQA